MDSHSSSNTDMAELWSGDLGRRWVRERHHFEKRLAHYGEAVLAAVSPQPGESGLDIGCGCGGTTFALAELVAPGGLAVGIDVSEPMIAFAREEAERCRWARCASFLLGDAAAYPLQARSFDLAISRFGASYFHEPAPAFDNIRRTLKPGGRLALICWRDEALNPQGHINAAVAPFACDHRETAAVESPGPFYFANPARPSNALSDAGFHGIEVRAYDTPMWMGDDVPAAVQDWSRSVSGHLRRLTAEEHARALEELSVLFTRHLRSDGVYMPSAAWIISAIA